MKKLCKEDFIEKSTIIHNNKFNYDLVNYKNVRTKVKIICPNCGEFEQLPWSHMKGIGCSKCNLLTTNKFIEKSNIKHNYRYNYDNSIIIDNKTKVIINCKIHGSFEQSPAAHMRGQGCIKCFKESKKSTAKKFIEKSTAKHNNLYNYDLVIYNGSKINVKIICKKHGIFEQNTTHHLNGSGCPICNESKGEKQIRSYLKINNIKYNNQKTFEDCKYKSKLRFDFYLIDYNICVEYNGIQHYIPNDYFGGIDGYNITKKRFKVKEKFCDENNIKLFIIKYDENIIEKLSTLIRSNFKI